MMPQDPVFKQFPRVINANEIPEKFTFPFYYTPSDIALYASELLQQELIHSPVIAELFDLTKAKGNGKMFGVLVVEDQNKNIGYLCAFSGKLGPYVHLQGFVSPVVDLYDPKGFYVDQEQQLNEINHQISALEQDPAYLSCKQALATHISFEQQQLTQAKAQNKTLKAQRAIQRQDALEQLSALEYQNFEEDLIKQSLRDKHLLRVLTQELTKQRGVIEQELQSFQNKIDHLKQLRKDKSNALQYEIFQHYQFLNYQGKNKDILSIFEATALGQPPAAAGECAAPKLLQHAYKNNYKPLALAEFWWGASPKSEIRKHLHYYPACTGKCEPILSHMLVGLQVDTNPLLQSPELTQPLEIVWEDQYMAIVNKPFNLLSVPGIYIQDSVYLRMKQRYPKATGPLIVHRLDMATSGILLIAKDKDTHKALQSQFIKHTIQKRYVALLDGLILEVQGEINLPLRGDLYDRPRQLVCFEHGKSAVTRWEVVGKDHATTKVYFYPITGRTHQLRVHASAPKGLNTAIVGDDLYGKKADRLYLHAQKITFNHPVTQQRMSFEVAEDF